MRAPDAASATRATHDKLTSRPPLRNGMRAFATRIGLCLSPTGNGSKLLKTLMSPQSSDSLLVRILFPADRWIIGSGFIEFAIKCRAPDFQTARNLGHLPTIMRDRKPDDLAFQIFKRSHLSGVGQHRQRSSCGQRRDWYLSTSDFGR